MKTRKKERKRELNEETLEKKKLREKPRSNNVCNKRMSYKLFAP